MTWNPDTYLKFQQEREAPFSDLVQHLQPRVAPSIVDLGCGPGSLTVHLLERYPDAQILGIDSSPEMLVKAAPLTSEQVQFALLDLRELQGQFDVVFSHAALQWVPDHESLIPLLWERVKPGGQLAVQVPSNFDHPTHTLTRQLLQADPYQEHFRPEQGIRGVLSIDQYAEILHGLGAEHIVCFQKVYPHVVAGAQGMLDWIRGTLLVPVRSALPPALYEAFEQQLLERLQQLYPGQTAFYGFKRTLFCASKAPQP